jgi:ribonuclease-3
MQAENGNADYSLFEQKIGLTFKDRALLEQSFTHRSYVNEHRGEPIDHNERLEFLGDAVLELAVTKFLFDTYQNKTEGELTALRAALVNTNTLSSLAASIGMNDFLRLSRGEAKDTGRARQYILANTFESVIGAIYLDQGYDAAHQFIANSVFPLTEDIVNQRLWQDNKSKFQEEAQDRVSITPGYQVLDEQGPDHDKHFTVGVYLGDELIAEGEGKSKQEAEQMAAKNALEEKGWA